MIKKTWKREISLALLVWLGYIVETKGVEIIQVLVWPIFSFSALSFGLDWYAKSNGVQQTPSEPIDGWGTTERSSQYSDRQRELSSRGVPDNPDGD